MTFQNLDVVRYHTGKTYLVLPSSTEQTIWATGWKDGRPHGAIRALDSKRCTLVGRAIRPATEGDGWHIIPVNEEGGQ